MTLIVGANAFAPLYPSPVGAVPSEATVIQLDADPYEIGRTYPATIGMLGDPRATLRAMTERVVATRTPAQERAGADRAKRWGEERAAGMAAIQESIAQARDATPMKPIVAVNELVGALPPGAAIVDDAVTSSAQVRTLLRASEPRSYFFTRGGGLGWGMPASIGVKLAMPERPVVAVVGDGTALYAPQALWTMAHHEVPVVNVVLNNRTYLILKQGMHTMAGKAAKAGVYPAMDIDDPAVDFGKLAASFGIAAEHVDAPSEIGPAVTSAIKSGKPALVEVDVDGAVG
jgi:benzoylformate decarboxylase